MPRKNMVKQIVLTNFATLEYFRDNNELQCVRTRDNSGQSGKQLTVLPERRSGKKSFFCFVTKSFRHH